MKARRKPQNLRKRSIYLAKEDPHASVKFKTTEEEAGSDEQSEKKIETRAVYSSDQSTVPQDIKKESALVDLEEEFREKESKEKNTQYFKEKRKNLAKKYGKEQEFYTGQKSYDVHVPVDENRYISKPYRPGPQPPPSNIRLTTFFDYKPDLCTDYKVSGYCGYGDTCKFIHDRTDYKYGFELEKDWEMAQKQKNLDNDDDEKYIIKNSDEEEETVCSICKKDFVSPIVTRCNHKFCEKCAIGLFDKTSRCNVCHMDTGGIFNAAPTPKKRRNVAADTTADFAKFNKGYNDESSWTYS